MSLFQDFSFWWDCFISASCFESFGSLDCALIDVSEHLAYWESLQESSHSNHVIKFNKSSLMVIYNVLMVLQSPAKTSLSILAKSNKNFWKKCSLNKFYATILIIFLPTAIEHQIKSHKSFRNEYSLLEFSQV